ncbi:hypothetical protein HUG20_01145 [Salicibibacter cibi]|uniref:Uncharacterized protein n=1 Tax=Salicibibacter cibi TaxID=2743001 RepID=A0A7T6Z806_9BACI|nr:hypothetical protein [Salicibibacter cibi]QQK78646.1 hypothetical protein HUG20_01145 [Salicibibacter cibi]
MRSTWGIKGAGKRLKGIAECTPGIGKTFTRGAMPLKGRIHIKYLLTLVVICLMVGCGNESFDEETFDVSGKNEIQEAYENGDLEEKVFDYEERFSQNDYAGDIHADSQTEFVQGSGDSNVLVSAPHTTTHIREDAVLDAEIYTGSIALLIQAFTGAHVIYNVHEGEDANHVLGGFYKEKIGEIIEEYEVDLVIDLHGAGGSWDFDLEIGTDHGETISDERADLLKYILENNGIQDVYRNENYPASGEGTVTYQSWHHYQTEAMQLEIHSDYRDPRNDFASYFDMLKSLVYFVDNVDQIDNPAEER